MYQIDVADAAVAKPAYAGAGVAGWFQDTEPTGGTTVPADWLNHVQAELKGLIEALGGVLNKADDTLLWTVLQPRVAPILGATADTGSFGTAHNRVAIGCGASQVTGAQSIVLAGSGHAITGAQSGVLAGLDHAVSGAKSVALGGTQAIVSGTSSMVAGSRYVELFTDYAVGGGYGAGAIGPTGANQNLSWLIRSNGGHAHFEGILNLGGDVGAGTGPLISLNGTNGNVGIGPLAFVVTGATGALEMAGDLAVATNKFTVAAASGNTHVAGDFDIATNKFTVAAASGNTSVAGTLGVTGLSTLTGGIELPDGSDAVAESYTEAVVGLGAGTHIRSTRSNNKIAADSIVLWSCSLGDPGAGTPELVAMGNAEVSSGQVKFTITNVGTGPITGTWYIRYIVINPA